MTPPATPKGPVRTLKVGDRVTVYGDLEIVGIDGKRVTVRVRNSSTPVMIPLKSAAIDRRGAEAS